MKRLKIVIASSGTKDFRVEKVKASKETAIKHAKDFASFLFNNTTWPFYDELIKEMQKLNRDI